MIKSQAKLYIRNELLSRLNGKIRIKMRIIYKKIMYNTTVFAKNT